MAKTLQHQVISSALALISNEAHWSRGAWARKANGTPCPWSDKHAVKFCAVGALNRAATDITDGVPDLAIRTGRYVLAMNGLSDRCLPHINDREGHARIIAMFKQALK